MIRVTGYAYIHIPYDITLDMTEAEFDEKTEDEQDALVLAKIDKASADIIGDSEINTINVEEIA